MSLPKKRKAEAEAKDSNATYDLKGEALPDDLAERNPIFPFLGYTCWLVNPKSCTWGKPNPSSGNNVPLNKLSDR